MRALYLDLKLQQIRVDRNGDSARLQPLSSPLGCTLAKNSPNRNV